MKKAITKILCLLLTLNLLVSASGTLLAEAPSGVEGQETSLDLESAPEAEAPVGSESLDEEPEPEENEPETLDSAAPVVTCTAYDQLTISWKTVKGAIGYKVYRSNSAKGTYSLLKSLTDCSYTDTVPCHGKTYYYKVVSFSEETSSKSKRVSGIAKCAAPTVTCTQPGFPDLTLSWEAVDGAEYYAVYRSNTKAGSYTRIGRTQKLKFTDTTLVKGHQYYYKVYPVRDSRGGTPSKIVKAGIYLAMPKSFTVKNIGTSDTDGAYLSWESSNGASIYRVYRSAKSASDFKYIATVRSNHYSDKKTKAATSYYYKVAAVNSTGSSKATSVKRFCFATSVALTDDTQRMKIGDTLTLSKTITPKAASSYSYTFTSSNPKVATVSASGEVEALAEGMTVITLATLDGKCVDTETILVTEGVLIVLDPGHGGYDCGAIGYYNGTSYYERNLNLKISKYTKAYLEKHYKGITVIMTRTTNDEYVSLEDRAKVAYDYQADAFISQHLNASESSASRGSEILISVNRRYAMTKLANLLLAQNEALGLTNRGLVRRHYDYGSNYGVDYYGVIRYSAAYGIPGMIIENAFLSNTSELAAYLSTNAKLKKLALANATAIATYYGLDEK